ncbi:MAG: NAD(P)H-quinone oxidoreductase [Polyangiaceae bacterium]|nr:NAD(P)H-quinone oxidoreductase [Polyangiaceae bacterium]
MRAIVVTRPGGPEVLALRDVPTPEPPPGHARVRVAFAGVNRADLLQRLGLYPAPRGAPADVPGLEYAGVIDALGAGVDGWREGDRVMGIVAGGAYAEHVVVHARELSATPAELSDEEAGAVPEAFVTAYDALAVRGRLAPGERVLVHAAGSGVGTAGAQIARALGCLVVGTSRTPDKLERCRALGLDHGVVPREGRFADEVRARCGGAGVDVVLDLVGGAYLPETLRALAPRGRVVLVGLTAGRTAEVDLGAVLSLRAELIGTVLRSRPLEEKIEAARLLSRTLAPWLARGVVRPSVDAVFPLEDAAAAHARVASNESFGKVLLRV